MKKKVTVEPIDYKKFPWSNIYGEHAMCEQREPGKCPECGTTSIDYRKFNHDEGDFCYWEVKCENGHKFEEWYSMEFSESVKRFPDVPEEARTK